MNEGTLHDAGLTKSEAKIYAELVKNSPCTPPKLSDLAQESRTNTYKILDALEAKGLVSRDDSQKKLRYWANSPANLLESMKQKRLEVEEAERRFQQSLPSLLNEYFKHSELPSIRYFHGIDGIKKVYEDQLETGEAIQMIHSESLADVIGLQNSHLLRNEFPKKQIARHMIFPDAAPKIAPGTKTMPVAESDKIMLQTRTWLAEDDLKEPVEWSVYGNKLSIISFGSELVGMIIESQQIAKSFRELLELLDRKIRAEPGYKKLPMKRLYTMVPESAKKKR